MIRADRLCCLPCFRSSPPNGANEFAKRADHLVPHLLQVPCSASAKLRLVRKGKIAWQKE